MDCCWCARKWFGGGALERLPQLLRHLYTIASFVAGWVIFRIEDHHNLAPWVGALFGAYGAGSISLLSLMNVLHYWPWFLVAAIGSTPLAARLMARLESKGRGACVVDVWLGVIFCWAVLSLLRGTFNPFIYFRF